MGMLWRNKYDAANWLLARGRSCPICSLKKSLSIRKTLCAELTTVTNQIFISKNDAYYKSPTANTSTPLAFLCSVSFPYPRDCNLWVTFGIISMYWITCLRGHSAFLNTAVAAYLSAHYSCSYCSSEHLQAFQQASFCSILVRGRLLQVINNDVNTTTNYTLEANIVSDNRTLQSSEQSSLASLYSQCCSATGACTYWKSLNANASTNANGGNVVTDFCSFPGQVCTPTGEPSF